MKRKLKNHHWGLIIGLTALVVIVLAVPVEWYVEFILGTQKKIVVTNELADDLSALITSLTAMAKLTLGLVVAFFALILYIVMKKK